MHKLTLIKITETFQLSHLYEHLFVAALDSFMRCKGWFQPIDYTVDARTYMNGVIIIDIELAPTTIEKDTIKLIKAVTIRNEETAIRTAIKQIEAEKRATVSYESIHTIQKLLASIEGKPWLDADQIDVINLTDAHAADNDLFIKEAQPTAVQTVTIYLSSTSKNSETLPLFRIIGGSLLASLGHDLSDNHGMFVTSGTFITDEHDRLRLMLETTDVDITEKDVQEMIEDIIEDMRGHAVQQRLSSQLQNNSYLSDSGSSLPSLIGTMENTGYIVGSKGWSRLATEANISSALDALAFTLEIS